MTDEVSRLLFVCSDQLFRSAVCCVPMVSVLERSWRRLCCTVALFHCMTPFLRGGSGLKMLLNLFKRRCRSSVNFCSLRESYKFNGVGFSTARDYKHIHIKYMLQIIYV